MPERIQLSRRKGWRKPENTVVVARPSRWGNPYVVQQFGPSEWAVGYREPGGDVYWAGAEATREAAHRVAVDTFRGLVTSSPGEWPVAELRGKNLGCWCPPGLPCHVDVLLELANGERESNA